jgi:hypothetical protein
MEPEGSLPHSQVPATCPYPEPPRYSPYPNISLSEDYGEVNRKIKGCALRIHFLRFIYQPSAVNTIVNSKRSVQFNFPGKL